MYTAPRKLLTNSSFLLRIFSPFPYQLLILSQRQPRSGVVFVLDFSPPPHPLVFFTPALRRDRRFEITNLTFRCLLHSARRAKLPGTIDFPRIIYRCHPKHLINTRSTLPAAPRSLFSQPVKIHDTPKMRGARNRGWSWVGASLLREDGEGKGSARSRPSDGVSTGKPVPPPWCPLGRLWDRSASPPAPHLQPGEGQLMQEKGIPAWRLPKSAWRSLRACREQD